MAPRWQDPNRADQVRQAHRASDSQHIRSAYPSRSLDRASSWGTRKRVRATDDELPDHITLHDLRHTAASLASSADANVKAVQRMLGLASTAMTLDTYADLFDDDLDAVAIALDHPRSLAVVSDL